MAAPAAGKQDTDEGLTLSEGGCGKVGFILTQFRSSSAPAIVGVSFGYCSASSLLRLEHTRCRKREFPCLSFGCTRAAAALRLRLPRPGSSCRCSLLPRCVVQFFADSRTARTWLARVSFAAVSSHRIAPRLRAHLSSLYTRRRRVASAKICTCFSTVCEFCCRVCCASNNFE